MTIEDVQRAAVQLFANQGFAATGIRQLGAAAGVKSSTLYHYAGGKDKILSAIMQGCLEELVRAGTVAMRESARPEIQLGLLVGAHVGLSALNPLTARVTDQEIRALVSNARQTIIRLRDDYEAMFAEIIERGERSGVFQIDDPQILRLALLEMCNGVSNWYQVQGRLSVTKLQDQFIDLAGRLVGINGLRAKLPDELPPPVLLPTEPVTSREQSEKTA